MKSYCRKSLWTLAGFVGLMTLGSSLQAQHGYMDTPVPEDLLLQSPALIHSSTKIADTCTVDPVKELIINDVSVVDDCYRTSWTGSCPGVVNPATRGAWTFGRIAEGIFGTSDPETLSSRVEEWLDLWEKDQVVNGDTILARKQMKELVVKPWEKASHGEGKLDMKKAPFRLLAIINRMDIGEHARKGGELRFIFGLVDQQGNSTPFTMILEYTIVADTCQQRLDFANAFHVLSSLPFGAQYNAALQAVTDRVVARGAAPGFLNSSPLIALRTNESYLGNPHELRSFKLALPPAHGDDGEHEEDGEDGDQQAQGRLVPEIHSNTPAERFQGTQTLVDFINEFAPSFFNGAFIADPLYHGQPFLAAVAHNDLSLGWGGPAPFCTSAPRAPRRVFSFGTCQGCHGKDTATSFTHVSPRQAGQPAQISSFLVGPSYLVRDECRIGLRFFDVPRRKAFQCSLLNLVCN